MVDPFFRTEIINAYSPIWMRAKRLYKFYKKLHFYARKRLTYGAFFSIIQIVKVYFSKTFGLL